MKKLKKKIELIIEVTKDGYSAYSNDTPICTMGKDLDDLMKNAIEVTELYYDNRFEISTDNFIFSMNLKQFFDYFKVLNSKQIAQRVGINPSLLSQYINGKKKPSNIQTKKILSGVHQLAHELTQISRFAAG